MNSSSRTNDTAQASTRIIADSLGWFWIASIAVSVITILGNSMVTLVIALTQRLRTRQNAFILSLAIADLAIGLFLTPTMFVCGAWISCDRTLQIVFYNFLLLSSTGNLVIMTFDRYLAVLHPFKYQRIMTNRTTGLLMLAAWCVPLVFSFVRLTWLYSQPANLFYIEHIYITFIDIVFGIVPCFGLLLTYCRIYIVVRKHRVQDNHQVNNIRYNNNNMAVYPQFTVTQSRSVKSVEFLGGVILVFVFCYCLNISVSFCTNLRICKVGVYVSEISVLLVLINSAMNFLVYAVLKRDFHQELLRICRKILPL